MLQTVLRAIEQDRDFVVDLQRRLTAIPALGPENGGGGEVDKAAALAQAMAAMGLSDVTEIRVPDDRVPCGYRPSLVYKIPGVDEGRTLWIMAHMDVVPVGDLSLWKTDPFCMVQDADLIFGRGVEDNQQGIVSAALLAKHILACGAKPPMNLGLMFVADEETGNRFGLHALLKTHRSLFGADDLFLVPDHGNKAGTEIEIAEKSVLWVKITVEGRQSHGSRPDLGVNSLRAAADFILRLSELSRRFDAQDPLYVPPTSTIEPTKKESNVDNINTIPGRDVFYIDARLLPQYDVRDVFDALRHLGDSIAADHGVTLSYDVVQCEQAAPPLSKDSAIYQRLGAAIKAQTGRDPVATGIGGGTFAAPLRRCGYQAAVWATLQENAHQPNERSSISATVQDAAIMARVLWG